MAQSLVCKDCDTLLRSVKEAQDHADATGHANFEESTEVVLKLRCTECGKICRSQVEWDLHSKRLGHTSFEDVTTASSETALDTEKEMEAVRMDTSLAAAEEKGTSDGSNQQTQHPEELVPAEVDPALLSQLTEMGFPHNRAVRALHFGGDGIDAAVAWLSENETAEDLDEPLMVPKATSKRKLTAEEAKARAQELVRRAKERREAEEKERERLRELERVRAGKEMALAARAEEEARLRRNAEERQREKEEADRAREAIRKKLEEDRRERRRQLGLPEEPTAEEIEEERRREREKAEEEAKRRLPVKPVTKSERMRELLVELKKAHASQDDGVRKAFETLLKFVTNVASNPGEEKFRRIRLTNPAVQKRVVAFKGAVEFLEVTGFRKDASGEQLEMPSEAAADRLVLEAAAENLTSALNNPFFGVL